MTGMYPLMAAVVGSSTVVSAVAVPDRNVAVWLVPVCAAGPILLWIVLPLVVRGLSDPATSEQDPRS